DALLDPGGARLRHQSGAGAAGRDAGLRRRAARNPMTRSHRWYGLLAWLASCAPNAPAQHPAAGPAATEAAVPAESGAGSATPSGSASAPAPAPSSNEAGEIEL